MAVSYCWIFYDPFAEKSNPRRENDGTDQYPKQRERPRGNVAENLKKNPNEIENDKMEYVDAEADLSEKDRKFVDDNVFQPTM